MAKSRDIADSASVINYIDGLTSDAQTQLDAKATLDGSPTFTGTVTATAFSGDGSGLTGVESLPSQTGNNGLFLTTNGSTASWGAAGSEIVTVTRTSNAILTADNNSNLIDITSGTFTQTFTSAATLGNGWFCYIRNNGTGDITLDPSGSETIDGLTSFKMYPQEVRLIKSDGTNLTSTVLTSFYKVFTASGTFTKPPGYASFSGLLWGGGGAGGLSGYTQATGGGGGACNIFNLPSSEFSSSCSVVIGAGGSASTSSSIPGGTGGTSSLDGNIYAYGGGGGITNAYGSNYYTGGGGGGLLSAGTTGQVSSSYSVLALGGKPANYDYPNGANDGFGGGSSIAGSGGDSYAGGGSGSGVGGSTAGSSVYGGGGGSVTGYSGGTSQYGGDGGSSNGASGSIPAGGGSGTFTSGTGAGARGELRIWGIV